MKALLFIFLGGGMGSTLRYLSQYIINKSFITPFPLGTFIINVSGSFLIGLFYILSERFSLSSEVRLLLTVGLCGGFTTFSTFTVESLNLFKEELYGLFLLNIFGSIIVGIAGVVAGMWTGKAF